MAVKWFSSVAAFLLLLLAIYGMIGAIFNYRELTSITHNNGKWPFNQKPIYKVFMSIQLWYLIAAILGLIGAFRDSTLYFLWSFFILLGIFSALLIFGVVCLRVSSLDVESDIYSAFRKNLTDENDVEWLSDIQYRNNCCGIFSYMDWSTFSVKLPNGNTSVPDSCCRRGVYYEGKNCGAGLLIPNKTVAEAEKIIYTNGCSPIISQMLWNSSKWIGGEMVIAAMFTFVVAVFIYSGVMKVYCAHDEIITAPLENPRNCGNNNNCDRCSGVSRIRSRRRSNNSSAKSNSANAGSSRSTEDANNNTRESCTRLQSGNRKGRGGNNQKSIPKVTEKSYCNRKGTTQNKRKTPQNNKNFNSSSQNFAFSPAKQGEISPFIRKFYNAYYNAQDEIMGNNELLIRQNLEMLMDPIEGNFSTLSTTPHPSGSLNFFTLQQSTSPTPGKGKNIEKTLKEPNISHYASLPMVTAYTNSNFSDRERGNDLFSDNHFYNASHYHRQRPPEFPKLSPELTNAINFVPGKFASPSLTLSTTLATIHEETESMKSGAASTSPKAASPNSSPQSLSEKSSTSCSEESTTHQPSLLYEDPRSVVIEIVDTDKPYNELSDEFTKNDTNLEKTDSVINSLKPKSTKEFSVSKSSSEEDQNENKNVFSGLANEYISLENSEMVRIPINLNTCVGIVRKDSNYIGPKSTSETVPILSGQENVIISPYESYNTNYALEENPDMVAL